MDDPKSSFAPGNDQKVVVYFEWEGPVGPHHFEGLWKNPEGKIVLISDFRYEAKTAQFNGYWSMILSEATPSGEWSLEARIDGEAAGVHTFVISTTPSAMAKSLAPKVLGAGELYQLALNTTVAVDKIAADGTVYGKGLGFWIGEGLLLTSFDVIDSSSSLRILLKDGSRLSSDQVVAANRWQDWALVKFDAKGHPFLRRAAKGAPLVGDRCMFLEVGPAGAKLADGSITGKNVFARAGERLLVASGITAASFGGPLFDEYGSYVGIIGGTIVPGADPIQTLGLLSDPGAVGRAQDWETTGLAVPQSLLPDFSSVGQPVALADFQARGQFLPPLVKSDAIAIASISSGITKDSRSMGPRDYRQVVSRRENKAAVFVHWNSSDKQKFTCVLRLYDADNKLLSESKPREISLSPGKYVSSSWDLSIADSSPGIYRVDLALNGKAGWRDFFRVTE